MLPLPRADEGGNMHYESSYLTQDEKQRQLEEELEKIRVVATTPVLFAATQKPIGNRCVWLHTAIIVDSLECCLMLPFADCVERCSAIFLKRFVTEENFLDVLGVLELMPRLIMVRFEGVEPMVGTGLSAASLEALFAWVQGRPFMNKLALLHVTKHAELVRELMNKTMLAKAQVEVGVIRGDHITERDITPHVKTKSAMKMT